MGLWVHGLRVTVGDSGRPRVTSITYRIISYLLRRWDMTAAKANARLLLDRLAYVGRGATAEAERRVAGRARARQWSSVSSGPRLWHAPSL